MRPRAFRWINLPAPSCLPCSPWFPTCSNHARFADPQNDEIAPHVASPDDSARHDSFVYTPTEVSRDENWGSRSNGTAGDGGGVSEP